jgi:hypothetical protein
MDVEEAIHLMSVAADTACNAMKIMESPWPPDEARVARAEAMFDQANAGIRDFLAATKGLKEDQFPEVQSARKEARLALSRHAKTLKLVKEYLP